jgi:adenine/guanine/hypoxanthine permease
MVNLLLRLNLEGSSVSASQCAPGAILRIPAAEDQLENRSPSRHHHVHHDGLHRVREPINPQGRGTALAAFGILTIAVLRAWNVKAAILIGILTTTLTGALAGLVHWHAIVPLERSFRHHAASQRSQCRRAGVARNRLRVFVRRYLRQHWNAHGRDQESGLLDKDNRIPRVNRILFTDATAAVGGSLPGTTTVVSYIESDAEVAAGGRTGVTSVVTGLLFVVILFAAPLMGAIPSAATAPALVVVGGLMMSAIAEIDWEDACVAVPAFLTLVTIPLTFSIANGLACGIISYVVILLARGRGEQVPWAAYLLALLLIIRFVYIGGRT